MRSGPERLTREPQCAETTTAIEGALRAAAQGSPSPERLQELGGGWVGEEALAIALYCALVRQHDFAAAIRLAVNHSGDTDSTGAITGNLMGALLGDAAIPPDWLDRLELREVIERTADDLEIALRPRC